MSQAQETTQPAGVRPMAAVLSVAFHAWCLVCTVGCVVVLGALLWYILSTGWEYLSWEFLNRPPSSEPENAGVRSAFWGSVWLVGLTAAISVPVGVGAAVYLEEYAPNNWVKKAVQTNIANLAGVPSIVYGILGLGVFVRWMALGRSVISGALTLSLVILPIVILASQEALRAVPKSIRSASYALGATKWQTTWSQVLPASLPGIMTGVILSIARSLGEAAPLIVVGAVAFVLQPPEYLSDPFTALPIQIFDWTGRPDEKFHSVAASGIIVLLVLLICLNAVAVVLRYKFGKRVKW